MQNIVLTLKTSDINLSDIQAAYANDAVTSKGSIRNSKNDDIFFMPKFNNLAAATNILFGMYFMFDSLLTFQNGQAYVSF